MKFHAFPETEVYINPNGHFVIKQENEISGDQFVFLPKSIANVIANKILKLESELVDFIVVDEEE